MDICTVINDDLTIPFFGEKYQRVMGRNPRIHIGSASPHSWFDAFPGGHGAWCITDL